MRTKYWILAAGLSAIVAGGVVFRDRLLPGHADVAAVAGTAGLPMPAHGTAKPPAAPGLQEPPRNSPDALPAWMNAATPPPAQAQPRSTAMAEERLRSDRLLQAMNRLQQLQSQKDIDPAKVDEALGQIEQANGSNVLQGVRLDVLRGNIRVAARMQKAAEELQAMQQRQVAADKKVEHQAQVNKKLAEIEAMQRELRMDFYSSGQAVARPQ